MWAEPAAVYGRVLSFLELRDWQPPSFGNFSYAVGRRRQPSEAKSPELVAWMRDYFRPHNERLYDLIGHDFKWGLDT